MVRFLYPETAEQMQFLDPEIVKMDKKFWIQKSQKWGDFWIHKSQKMSTNPISDLHSSTKKSVGPQDTKLPKRAEFEMGIFSPSVL